MTRMSYEPNPSLTHSPAKRSRGLRPERSKIEKSERAGSGNGTSTVEGTVARIWEGGGWRMEVCKCVSK